MTLQQRILNKIDLNSPPQVRRAVGSLYYYYQHKPDSALLQTTEWIYNKISHHTKFEWQSVLKYIRGVIALMKKS